MPNSDLFTHHLLFFPREATSETYGPRVSSLLYFPLRFYLLLFLDLLNEKYKNTLLQFILIYFISRSREIYLSNLLQFYLSFYPWGIDNPSLTSGCKYLFFVCRSCLRGVAWFSYWYDNLGLITEGNTYHCCVASSLPLWGNTDIVQANIKRNFLRRCPRDIINIYQVPNHKSHLLAIYIICHLPLIFLSPSSQLFTLFFIHPFLIIYVFGCNLVA